jgi:hypothetical protein
LAVARNAATSSSGPAADFWPTRLSRPPPTSLSWWCPCRPRGGCSRKVFFGIEHGLQKKTLPQPSSPQARSLRDRDVVGRRDLIVAVLEELLALNAALATCRRRASLPEHEREAGKARMSFKPDCFEVRCGAFRCAAVARWADLVAYVTENSLDPGHNLVRPRSAILKVRQLEPSSRGGEPVPVRELQRGQGRLQSERG